MQGIFIIMQDVEPLPFMMSCGCQLLSKDTCLRTPTNRLTNRQKLTRCSICCGRHLLCDILTGCRQDALHILRYQARDARLHALCIPCLANLFRGRMVHTMRDACQNYENLLLKVWWHHVRPVLHMEGMQKCNVSLLGGLNEGLEHFTWSICSIMPERVVLHLHDQILSIPKGLRSDIQEPAGHRWLQVQFESQGSP